MSGTLSSPVRSTISVTAPAMTKSASPIANGTSTGPPPSMAKITATPIAAIAAAPMQALRDAKEIAALPGQQRAERHRDQKRHEQRREGRVEERRPDRNLLAGERFERERIERADEHRGAGASPGTDC